MGMANYPLSNAPKNKHPILLAFVLRGHIFDLRHFTPSNVRFIHPERDNALDAK